MFRCFVFSPHDRTCLFSENYFLHMRFNAISVLDLFYGCIFDVVSGCLIRFLSVMRNAGLPERESKAVPLLIRSETLRLIVGKID